MECESCGKQRSNVNPGGVALAVCWDCRTIVLNNSKPTVDFIVAMYEKGKKIDDIVTLLQLGNDKTASGGPWRSHSVVEVLEREGVYSGKRIVDTMVRSNAVEKIRYILEDESCNPLVTMILYDALFADTRRHCAECKSRARMMVVLYALNVQNKSTKEIGQSLGLHRSTISCIVDRAAYLFHRHFKSSNHRFEEILEQWASKDPVLLPPRHINNRPPEEGE